jgi:hypothetical protein
MIRGAGVSMLPAPVVSDHPRQDTANDSGCQPFLVKNGYVDVPHRALEGLTRLRADRPVPDEIVVQAPNEDLRRR